MAKKRPPKPRKRQKRQEIDRGTDETRARLRPDPILVMIAKGLVDTAQERAASEIRQVYLAITQGLWLKNRVPGQITGIREELSDEMAEAYSKRYYPWVQRVNSDVVDATLRLCVEREEPTEWGERQIAGALYLYAKMF